MCGQNYTFIFHQVGHLMRCYFVWCFQSAIFYQIHAQEEAAPTHISDDVIFLQQFLQSRPCVSANPVDIFQDIFCVNDINDCIANRCRYRVAAKGIEVAGFASKFCCDLRSCYYSRYTI